MKEKIYITTPIYYPNDVPHLGHAYTTIACDIISRWNKINNKKVLFTTGTDEHGKKIEESAKKNCKSPKEFVDELIPKFKDYWKKLNIDYDEFIRTTDENHKKIVRKILQKVYDNGDIYLGEYEGFYCTACEAYYTEKDLVKGCCPIHKTKIEKLKEESYFFRLSKYQNKLLELYEKNPNFLQPKSKRNEIVKRLKKDIRDLSISRTSFDWGIKIPFDEKHICYVWFDALFNYYTLIQEKARKSFWPPINIIGKDILWFHAVYWPAFLLSLNIPLPKKIFAHGWWTIEGKKMSKTTGSLVKIEKLISIAGLDSARYFLFRAKPFGDDGDFSEKALIDRHNNELADKLGNLVSRVTRLIEKNGIQEKENQLIKKLKLDSIEEKMDNFEFDKVLNTIFAFIDICNEYIQEKKPWETKNTQILYELADSIKSITILLYSFIPETSQKISKHFNFKINYDNLKKPLNIKQIKRKKINILFEKIK